MRGDTVERIRVAFSQVGVMVRGLRFGSAHHAGEDRFRSAVAAAGHRAAGPLIVLGAVGMTAAGCAGGSGSALRQAGATKATMLPAVPAARAAAAAGSPSAVSSSPGPEDESTTAPQAPPGIGNWLGSHIPSDSGQVVAVRGTSIDAPTSTATLYQRTSGTWRAEGSWPTHNALDGWTTEHRLNDLRSPIGVFTLTDAGGLLPDPGSRMPYYHSSRFTIRGLGFDGKPLSGAFDYVVAINYNRVPGDSPLDARRPDGWRDGGGIWLHVDHGGPTHGCVTLPKEGMLALLRALDPAQHPVVVMGDQADLAR